VRNEGEFDYNKSISIKDLLTMAGGLKYNASRTKIDVYRLNIEDDNKTKTIAATLQVNENLELVGSDFELKPFDQIIIRYAPEFEEIKNIILTGEIKYPGTYAIINENETIASIIKRAGGITEEGFAEGAKLIRASDQLGYISFDLEEALSNKNSDQNLILKKDDRIIIPKKQEIVSITGATNANSIYSSEVLIDGIINTPHESGKNAMYYINKYCGGLSLRADKSSIYVKYPNGELHKTKRFLFFYKYPEVKKGSLINIGFDKDELNPKEENNTDWGQIFQDSIGQVTAVLTLLLLVQRLD
jgi:protein involved in polysaccharide export with SLBB domain